MEPRPNPDEPDGIPPNLEDHHQHDSLKYHLLGPSLTKAGQDSVDQSKVFVIYSSPLSILTSPLV